ncbi:MAG: hypothetical protein R3Y21_05030 [Mycoplasmatota bacterium]
MNIEYEYSFKVKNIDKYIKYCENNNYKKQMNNRQVRKLYKNDTNIMGRVTTNYKGNKKEILFDFKNNDESDKILKENMESIPLNVKENDLKSIESILLFLNLKLDKVLDRTRIVYEKNNVKFEIDKYISPELTCVVAIEGKKEEVDVVYNEVNNL